MRERKRGLNLRKREKEKKGKKRESKGRERRRKKKRYEQRWNSNLSSAAGGLGEHLTLGLFDARSYTAQEIIWGHENLVIPMIPIHLQSRKVSKNLVWG